MIHRLGLLFYLFFFLGRYWLWNQTFYLCFRLNVIITWILKVDRGEDFTNPNLCMLPQWFFSLITLTLATNIRNFTCSITSCRNRWNITYWLFLFWVRRLSSHLTILLQFFLPYWNIISGLHKVLSRWINFNWLK